MGELKGGDMALRFRSWITHNKGFKALASLLLLTPLLLVASQSPSVAADADSFYNFSDMAMSGNGQIIYITNSEARIWKSTNAGSTWSPLTSAGTHQWSTIATSQDGSVVVATENSENKIFISTNGGTTWVQKTISGATSWRALVVSNDGTKIKAITSNSAKLYESSDTGANWTENATLPTTLNTGFNPDGTRSSNGCWYSLPCPVNSWAALSMSGTGNKIALLASASGSYQSGRQLFISQDGGATWVQTEGCCRDQSTVRQMASSRSDTNWTIIMGNYQSAPGYLRYDSSGSAWTRSGLRVHEVAGDATSINTTTWKTFAIAADGDQTIFSGAYAGWVEGQPGRHESLFTGSISSELSGVFHDESPGYFYEKVAISDDGSIRAAFKASTGDFILSTDSGITFTKSKVFALPLTPTFGAQTEYASKYTLQISNYDASYSWNVSSTSGTASINGSGLVTVLNPVGASTLTVTSSKAGFPDGTATYSARTLEGHITTTAIWTAVPAGTATEVFAGGNSIYDIAISPTTGDLYVGGDFLNAAGIADADYIARFDGTNWHALSGPSGGLTGGSGNGYQGVSTIKFDAAGNVYVGGNFINAGGDANADYVAKWNGTSWSALGSTPLTNTVRAIDVLTDGRILVGGHFTNAAGITGANYLASWNGSAWSKFGASSLDGIVRSIAHSKNGNVYIGGHFNNAGGNSAADKIAKYSGTDWTVVGPGLPFDWNPVMTIAIDDRTNSDVVYAGGQFYDGAKWQGIAKFSGETLTFVDEGFTNAVRKLRFNATYGLFVAGWFNSNNRYASGLGILKDDNWYGVGDANNDGSGSGSAMGTNVEALEISTDGKIYVGGYWNSAAGLANSKLLITTASWTPKYVTPTPSPTPTVDKEAERKKAEAEKAARKLKVRADILKGLEEGKPIAAKQLFDADLPLVSSKGLILANQMLMDSPLEMRLSEAYIEKIFTKVAFIDDLTSEFPQTMSVQKLIDYGLFPDDLISPALTLHKLKQLPMSERSDMDAIHKAIAKLQEPMVARKARTLANLTRVRR